ncbi:MAG: hemolysin family protein [Chitinophagaceae bacterium]|jgi:CBS domain containing-hemolysin-like protein|nr:hemolysin family protein [Chitinophagaceae bacterium]
MELILLIGIIAVFLLAGFFSGIEVAFVSANKLPIELKKKQGLRSGKILSDFMDSPAKFIGTTLIGFNLALVTYGLLIGEFLSSAWTWAEGFLDKQFVPYLQYIRLLFDTVLASAMILLYIFFNRAIFKAKNDTLLSFFAPIVDFFYGLLYPIASFFVSASEWILKYLFNVRLQDEKDAFNRVDLEQFIQQTREQSEDNNELNTELFEAALSLPSIKIRQCLVPRKEIEALDINAPIAALRQKFMDTKLSKLVVYEKNIDHIVGYVHQLSLFKNPPDIRSVTLPIPAVPESMSATDLITRFSRERKSIAWVVDEFGGTSGIITMEDLLEEIFGEIKDEYDVEEFVEKQLAEREYIFSGRLELDYLNEKYGFGLPVEQSETLSGFIITQHESIPRQRERIILDNYEFEVLNVSDTRIETVKMKVLQ